MKHAKMNLFFVDLDAVIFTQIYSIRFLVSTRTPKAGRNYNARASW